MTREDERTAASRRRLPHPATVLVAFLVMVSGYLFFFGYPLVMVNGEIWIRHPTVWPFVRRADGVAMYTDGLLAFSSILLLACVAAAFFVERWVRGRLGLRSVAGLALAALCICGLIAWLLQVRPDHVWADVFFSPQYFPFIGAVACLVSTVVGGCITFLGGVVKRVRAGRPSSHRCPDDGERERNGDAVH